MESNCYYVILLKFKKKDKQENNKKKKSLECRGNKKYEKLPLAV